MELGHSMVLSASYGDNVIDFGMMQIREKNALILWTFSENILLSDHIATDFGNCIRISPKMFQNTKEKEKVFMF